MSPNTATVSNAGDINAANDSASDLTVVSCNYAIAPNGQTFTATGGTASVSVMAASGCQWIATSNAGFITITSGSGGTGDGAVNYAVAPNSGSDRNDTITIAGQTFTVTQTFIEAQNPNVALASNGATAVASSVYNAGYPATAVIDGDHKGLNATQGGVWADGTPGVFPDWVEVDFSGSKFISEIDVYTIQDNYKQSGGADFYDNIQSIRNYGV